VKGLFGESKRRAKPRSIKRIMLWPLAGLAAGKRLLAVKVKGLFGKPKRRGTPKKIKRIILWSLTGLAALVLIAIGLHVSGKLAGRQQPVQTPDTLTGPQQPVQTPERNLTTEEIVAKSEASIALIKGKVSGGSGFLVRPGILVTNSHVIRLEFMENVRVHFPSAPESQRGPLKVRLLAEDVKRDWALLAIDSELPPLEVAGSYTFKRGQEVIVIGNPSVDGKLTLENAVSRGLMSSKATVKERSYYQLSVAVNPGNSGGPVLDSAGKVIGIVTLKGVNKEGMAFSIPVEELNAALGSVARRSDEMQLEEASRHRLLAVFQLLDALAAVYGAGLEDYGKAMERTQKDSARNEFRKAIVNQIDKRIAPLKPVLADDLMTNIARISSDALLTQPDKEQLLDLRKTCNEMTKLLDNPSGDPSDFRANQTKLRERHKELSEKLKGTLGLD
jgi:S1-C subfamily serine protease